MNRNVAKSVIAVGIVALFAWLIGHGQGQEAGVVQAVRARQLYLADLWNGGFRIVFPPGQSDWIPYRSPDGYYGYSVIAANGRSLFAFRRTFGADANPVDTLVKRVIRGTSIGTEESVPFPFINVFDCAVSSNDMFMAVAGRLKDQPTNRRDGVFLLNEAGGSVEPVALYSSESLNREIRSLSVSDRGDVLLYEDSGSVMRYTRSEGGLKLTERHPGAFPALMPDGKAYIYVDGGRLLLVDGQGRRELLRTSAVVGGIRVSPDGNFVAFGEGSGGYYSRLRICDLKARRCVDGPGNSEQTAGRETFWIKQ